MTAEPPKECPTSSRTSRPEVFMYSTARAVSATLWENEPSPQSPSDSPRPRLSKRSMPMPSLASCLQIRLAAGESLPSVKPWAKTPHPRTSPSGRSTRPARVGPVVLGNFTRSATRVILSARGERFSFGELLEHEQLFAHHHQIDQRKRLAQQPRTAKQHPHVQPGATGVGPHGIGVAHRGEA